MEWFNVKDKQPNDVENVLLYTPFEFFGEAHSCVGNIEGIRSCTTKIGKRTVPVFTHWMPLPPKPYLPISLRQGEL